ncbi:cytochrome P450 [Mycena metata]|uniref:Cytochrome P450 n=1 Tax=Mycena metata TaxID=1033252 RepID=A0AAD7MTY8_9AGAR|nr:cytochrome P450 [Mycena metata]
MNKTTPSFILNGSPQEFVLAVILTTVLGIAIASYLYFGRPNTDTGIHSLGGLSFLNAWRFFTTRHDFLRESFHRTNQRPFEFSLFQLNARKLFFHEKSLNLNKGYAILLGGGPKLADINVNNQGSDEEALFPLLLSDIEKITRTWGPEGTIDPFTEVYKLVFQVTVRMATCRELADDPAEVSQLFDLYSTLEKSSTAAALLLPWFPSPARKAKTKATAELFKKLCSYVEVRRNATVPSNDAIDVLLAQFILAEGVSTNTIVGFVLSTIFAGVVNSGMSVGWALIYLGMNAVWKAKATAEVRALLSRHGTSPSDPLHKQFASIPVSAWDEEMPVADAVIRETLRLAMSGLAIRRNLENDIALGGHTVARGDFLTYWVSEIHFDPSVYPDPFSFDPGRYDVGREEDKRVPLAYLGWGAGRHVCAGMRLAKLEMKLVTALFLAGFEYEPVDGKGQPLTAVPQIDRNDIQRVRGDIVLNLVGDNDAA